MVKIIEKSELWLIKNYLLNAAKSLTKDDISAEHDLFKWIIDNQKHLKIPPSCQIKADNLSNEDLEKLDFFEEGLLSDDKKSRRKKTKFVVKTLWFNWLKKYEQHIKSTKPKEQVKIEKIAAWVGQLCDLSPYETEVLKLLALYEKHNIIGQIGAAAEDSINQFNRKKYGIDEDEYALLIGNTYEYDEHEKLKIEEFGFVKEKYGRKGLEKNIRKIFATEIDNDEKLKSFLYGDDSKSNLIIDNFSYIGENLNIAKNLLENHKRQDNKPLNIFIYGPPGTGKTEFAKTLGSTTNRTVHFIGEHDENNRDISRNERISALMLLGGLKDNDNSKLLVIDEADEILSDINSGGNFLFKILGKRRGDGSKIFLNRLLENITIPIIWIINEHDDIDEAVMRRMNYCLEFPKPPLEVRKNIIKKIADDNQAILSQTAINELALYDASPAYLENAIRLGKNINGDLSKIRQILENNICVSGSINKTLVAKGDFKLELCNANMDLIALRDRVKNCTTTKLTFCFSGGPGTGKSEYARFLAKELGYEVLYKRYSDLASMWLGQTEKNIAAAFREATQKKAFLILDEADSLLLSREGAQKSWEVTQVNEFLTQIENHNYPFAITTNSFDKLDTAAMRRFLFKVKFEAMTREQVSAAYLYFFGESCPNELLYAEGLTPADFALVRNQSQILGVNDASIIAKMLIEESATRGNVRQRIGF